MIHAVGDKVAARADLARRRQGEVEGHVHVVEVDGGVHGDGVGGEAGLVVEGRPAGGGAGEVRGCGVQGAEGGGGEEG